MFDPVDHICEMASIAASGIRGGQRVLDLVEGPLHPRGLSVERLRNAEKLLRDLADAIQAKRESVTEAERVAA